MTRFYQLLFVLSAFLFVSACGSVPTDGLTASLGTDQTKAETEAVSGPMVEIASAGVEGVFDPASNIVRLTYSLKGNNSPIADEELFIFGGGTRLLGYVDSKAEGNYTFRYSEDVKITAVSFKQPNQPQTWTAGLIIPKLNLQSPSGETQVIENVSLSGVLAASPAEIPARLQNVFGTNMDGSYQSFLAFQKQLFANHPNPTFIMNLAIQNGMSGENAQRIAALSMAETKAESMGILADILSSKEDEAFRKAIVISTIEAMKALDVTSDQIETLFSEELGGQVSVDLSKVGNGDWSSIQINEVERDDSGSTSYVAASSDSSNSSGSVENPSGGEDGSDTGGDGGDTGGDGNDGGDTGGGDGNDGGDTGGDGNNGGGTDGEEPEPGFWDNLWNSLQDIFGAALEGALTGALAGLLTGGLGGMLAGAGTGALVGALTYLVGSGDGVYDPGGPDSPCRSPLLNC